ncbi:MAG: hypothetical protein DRN90_03860 [Thermoproteota archaeon]|nr:MAG: hypothetical protein DRN90_03860 [Candidatus Korarchaeota archaeon]
MSLRDYRDKRDFSRSSEPIGSERNRPKEKGLIYVIQEHHARRLHYDLRLEMGGVLRSWAIPKEPPIEPGVKRLAIQTEDHPVEYAYFEGCLEYGTMVLTDSGLLSIGEIVEKRLKVNVLSFNIFKGRMEWKPIIGWFKNGQSSGFMELSISNNSSSKKLVLTPNHVIYTPLGKKKAEELRIGDYVLVAPMLDDLKAHEISVGKVESIGKADAGNIQRYDIQVKQNQNYFAESILVSNSIPEGLYGAGLVKIWDRGTYEPIELSENKLVFEINGIKLRGKYALIRTRWKGRENYWLFFKMKEDPFDESY